jgi:hypothetical protein
VEELDAPERIGPPLAGPHGLEIGLAHDGLGVLPVEEAREAGFAIGDQLGMEARVPLASQLARPADLEALGRARHHAVEEGPEAASTLGISAFEDPTLAEAVEEDLLHRVIDLASERSARPPRPQVSADERQVAVAEAGASLAIPVGGGVDERPGGAREVVHRGIFQSPTFYGLFGTVR